MERTDPDTEGMSTTEPNPVSAEQPPKVLLVDDHQIFAELLAQALTLRGMTVTAVCGSVAAAITQTQSTQPDVVILDHGLPEVTGAEAIADLKHAASDVRVLMLTGDDDPGVLRAGLAAGCDGYLTKRQDMDAVVAAVRAVLRGETPISPDVAGELVGRHPSQLGDDLTPRETGILDLIGQGLTNREIAANLGISVNTVRNHIQHLLVKLDAHSKLEAVTIASRNGILRMQARR